MILILLFKKGLKDSWLYQEFRWYKKKKKKIPADPKKILNCQMNCKLLCSLIISFCGLSLLD